VVQNLDEHYSEYLFLTRVIRERTGAKWSEENDNQRQEPSYNTHPRELVVSRDRLEIWRVR
jgi:hypothetical protein